MTLAEMIWGLLTHLVLPLLGLGAAAALTAWVWTRTEEKN
ncbi:membrane protein [Mycobacterium phage ScoobyDoobyDoo]|nr:membrane protein [Mycobacterium phage ScoobyDoobyDoo]